ncbi:MAG: RteC domain-containing protein [Cyclobacteriaceae bacterium]|nr:RteC domain-containing protein [Cyclobacteriaceae bacterium]
MDILTYSKQLESRMKERLENFNPDQDEILKTGHALTFIREIIAELKQFASTYKFTDEPEEIRFFKEIKPVFLSQFFYYKKVFALRLFDSFKDLKTRQANYYKILQQLERFVQKNLEFYEYCMTNTTYLDKHYFTRNRQNHKSIDRDEKFSTGYDTKLAKILANELLKKYILDQLKKSQADRSTDTSSTLTWTGSKTDLIELIYALHSVDVFNNGTANIKVIASAFEDVFNISLGDYYRTFQDMRIRKRSQTPFLDILKERFTNRLSSE